MAEVFISYARTDQGFARDLNNALRKLNRDTWIDWRSIPESAKWRAEIFAAIDDADNFLFIISPDSLRSEMCGLEVAHAFSVNKRVITILYHSVDRKDLLPGLGEIQWINYPDLGGEETFQRLVTVLDTDLAWVNRHKQLLVRAKEWDTNNREGYLLHGLELREAVRWLERAPTIKNQQPTELHERYIRASEEWEAGEIQRLTELTEEKERQRQEAERQRQEAVNQREHAERARREVEKEKLKAEKAWSARELAAFSNQGLAEDPERSILLAMHAVDTTRIVDGMVTPEAECALHEAILSYRLRFTLRGHEQVVTHVAMSEDGRTAVSASWDHILKVWDLQTESERRNMEGRNEPAANVAEPWRDWPVSVRVCGLAISGDGKLAAFASKSLARGVFPLDQSLHVWDVQNGCGLRTIAAGHCGVVSDIAMSRDGRLAVTASKDRTLNVWELRAGRHLRTLRGHTDAINAVALSGDGRLALSASDDQTLKVWDVRSGRELRTLVGHSDVVCDVALNGDGRMAASASRDKTLKVWDVGSGRELCTLVGHGDAVSGVALSGDGRLAVSASDDQTIRVWNTGVGCEVRTLRTRAGATKCAAVSGDGWLVVSVDGQTLRGWDVRHKGELRLLPGHPDVVSAICVSANCKLVVSASWDKTLIVWGMVTGHQLHVLRGHSDWVHAVTLTSDGLGVSASADRTLRLWNLENGREVRTLVGHASFVNCVALSGSGRWVVSGSSDNTLKVWDLENGRELRTLHGHSGAVWGVALSADGRLAVSASWDKTLKVWEVESGRVLHTLEGHSDAVNGVAVSADGQRAVSASDDQTLRVWDVESGRVLRSLQGHSSRVHSVVMNSDGTRAASASEDKTVKIWDINSGRELVTFADHSRSVRSVAWAPDGKRLLSGGEDGLIQVYAMEIDLLMSLARSRVTRNLTSEECRKYLHRDDVPPLP